MSSSRRNGRQLSEERESLESTAGEGKALKKKHSELNDADSTLGDFMKTFVLH